MEEQERLYHETQRANEELGEKFEREKGKVIRSYEAQLNQLRKGHASSLKKLAKSKETAVRQLHKQRTAKLSELKEMNDLIENLRKAHADEIHSLQSKLLNFEKQTKCTVRITADESINDRPTADAASPNSEVTKISQCLCLRSRLLSMQLI